jgi:hypothetical protein
MTLMDPTRATSDALPGDRCGSDGAQPSGCDLSLEDLFRFVHRRDPTPAELETYRVLSQPDRNALVKELIGLSDGAFVCEDRSGTDGVTYTAFWSNVSRR